MTRAASYAPALNLQPSPVLGLIQRSVHKRFCCRCLADKPAKGCTYRNGMYTCNDCKPKEAA